MYSTQYIYMLYNWQQFNVMFVSTFSTLKLMVEQIYFYISYRRHLFYLHSIIYYVHSSSQKIYKRNITNDTLQKFRTPTRKKQYKTICTIINLNDLD